MEIGNKTSAIIDMDDYVNKKVAENLNQASIDVVLRVKLAIVDMPLSITKILRSNIEYIDIRRVIK